MPGRDVAIDEAMARFEGRSYDTLIIPSKPIDEGYKIWVLAQSGYFLAWCFHRKGKTKAKRRGDHLLGPWKVPQPKALGDNSSSAVVAYLMEYLPHNGYIIYLDNLFTNVKLCRYARERGWGIIGTCTAKSGISKSLVDKKKVEEREKKLAWGTLYTEPSEDNFINFMAWKDNALVLFMTTCDEATAQVERLRKRPSESSTMAKTSRKPFGDQSRAILSIPSFDDAYNMNMGAVDQGDALKATNNCSRRCRRGGHQSLETWLLDTSLVNAYLLSFHSSVSKQEKYTDQSKFRTDVIDACFARARIVRTKRKTNPIDTPEPVLETPRSRHLKI